MFMMVYGFVRLMNKIECFFSPFLPYLVFFFFFFFGGASLGVGFWVGGGRGDGERGEVGKGGGERKGRWGKSLEEGGFDEFEGLKRVRGEGEEREKKGFSFFFFFRNFF